MESIRELRTQLQKEKVAPLGWSRPPGYVLFQRGPSIYLTWILLHTRVRPNTITKLGFLFGLVGCLFLLQFEWHYKLIGIFVLYLHILLDKVDGEIARYRNTYSLEGIFWDEVNHLVIPPLFWISLVFGISKISIFRLDILFALGALGAIALVVNRIVHSLAPQIYAKKYLKRKELFSLEEHVVRHSRVVREIGTGVKSFFRAVNYFQDFFAIIASVAVLIIFERLFFLDYIFHPLLNYFVFIASILFTCFAAENILRKGWSIESDIRGLIDELHKKV